MANIETEIVPAIQNAVLDFWGKYTVPPEKIEVDGHTLKEIEVWIRSRERRLPGDMQPDDKEKSIFGIQTPVGFIPFEKCYMNNKDSTSLMFVLTYPGIHDKYYYEIKMTKMTWYCATCEDFFEEPTKVGRCPLCGSDFIQDENGEIYGKQRKADND